MANGIATIASGVNTTINHLAGTNLPEENVLRTASRKVGRAIGGKRGERVGAAVYDTVNAVATIYSVFGGGSTALSKTAKALGTEVKITKLSATMIGPSVFTDVYKVERAMSPIVECINLPKTWFKVTNGIGSLTDLTLTTINIFGDK